MVKISVPWDRLGTITALAERWPKGWIGRTALMKAIYFLQTLREVPLGYNFTLYSYGPCDTDVLHDLDFASALDFVRVETKQYPDGYYGYEISTGPDAASAKEAASEFLSLHANGMGWVVSTFGRLSVAELELTSTLVYVDREAARSGKRLQLSDLVHQVREIKPRFSPAQITGQAESLRTEHLLESLR